MSSDQDASEHTRESEFTERPELIKRRARAMIVQSLTVAIVGLFLVIAVVVLILDAYHGSQTREQLLDCTEPSGTCFQEGQARQGEVVKQLIDAQTTNEETTRKIVILAAACSDSIDQKLVRQERVRAIEDCVNEELTRVEQKEKAEGEIE